MARLTIGISIATIIWTVMFALMAQGRVLSEGKMQNSDDDRIFQGHGHDSIRAYDESLSRVVPIKARVYRGTLDSDSETYIDVSEINGDIVGAIGMVEDETETGNWEIYDNRAEENTSREFKFAYYASDHATAPNTVGFTSVGSTAQGEPYRLIVFYIPKGEG